MTETLTLTQELQDHPLQEGDTVEVLDKPAMIYVGAPVGFKHIPNPKPEAVGKRGRIWSTDNSLPEPAYTLSGEAAKYGKFYPDQLKRV